MSGRAWVFGPNIDTDVLAPGHLMKLAPDALARHCLEAVDPRFAKEAAPGDVIVAGSGFGIGSSREQAAVSLTLLGVKAVLAESFARIFYRNALNLGLVCLVFPEAREVRPGDIIAVDPVAGRILNETQERAYSVNPIPAHLMAMIEAGGLAAHLKARFARERGEVA